MYRDVNFGKISATSLSLTSDLSKKKNVKKCEKALDTLYKLDGVSWDWKIEEYGKSSGLIADDLNEIKELKYMINGEKGNFSIQYNCLHGYYIEAIKELKNKINNLEQNMNKMKKEIIELKLEKNNI